MAKKRSVSTSRADRTDEKNKRNARKPIYPTNKKEALYAAGGAAAGAAGVAASRALKKTPKPDALYRGNQLRNLKSMGKAFPGMSREDILRLNRKAAADLARAGKITSKAINKGPKGSGGGGVRKDDSWSKVNKAKRFDGVSKSRYYRLTGGGAGPGRGMGQGGRGGGGFLRLSK